MKIGEIAKLTGLSVSNIRFYEKKGLIGPQRDQESQYRNYDEEDLKELRKIILYRKMDFSVELIGRLQKSELTLAEALSIKQQELIEQSKMLQSSLDLCDKMLEDQVREDYDVNYYLTYVKEEESKGKVFAHPEEFMEMIEDFSNLTQYNQLVEGFLVGLGTHRKPWMNYVLPILWSILFLLVPVCGLVDALYSNKAGIDTLFAVVFFSTYLVLLLGSFTLYRRHKKEIK